MLTINVSGLDSIIAKFDRLSRLEELNQALRRSAEAVRDRAALNLSYVNLANGNGPGAAPPSVTPGGAPLTWRIVSASESGWRAEWGGMNSAPRPWFGPAADSSREDIVRNAAGGVAAAARALR